MRTSSARWLAGLLAAACSTPLLAVITPGQSLTVNFTDATEFNTLQNTRGWIFRVGAGTSATSTCDFNAAVDCGWASMAGEASAAHDLTQVVNRWMITEPITFGAGASVTFRIRKSAVGDGAFDVRQNEGSGTDTGAMPEAVAIPERGGVCTPTNGSFCRARGLLDSGASIPNDGTVNCTNIFQGTAGIPAAAAGASCTVTIPEAQLLALAPNTRLAFVMRTGSLSSPAILLDQVSINAGAAPPPTPIPAGNRTLWSVLLLAVLGIGGVFLRRR